MQNNGSGNNETNGKEKYQARESLGRARPAHFRLYMTLAAVVLAGLAAFLIFTNLFHIKTVLVTGLVRLDENDVVRQAGITANDNYFSVNEAKIRKNIESSRYLRLISVEKKWSDTVLLTLAERTPRVNLTYMGTTYILASDGMVLDSSRQISLDNGCIGVTGLDVRDVRLGAIVACEGESRLQTMGMVLEELEEQDAFYEFSELNLLSLDSIYLVTTDGYTANIGDNTELRAKIGTVRAVAAELRSRGEKNGLIEATIPGLASYRRPQ